MIPMLMLEAYVVFTGFDLLRSIRNVHPIDSEQ